MSLLENGTFEAFRCPGTSTGKDPVHINPLLPNSKDTENPIKIPFDANLIGCKWVFKTEVNPDDTIRFKASLVIKRISTGRRFGFHQDLCTSIENGHLSNASISLREGILVS